VRSVDGSQGGVESLSIQVNSENYKSIIELFKKAIIENGRGYDAKDDRLGGNANQLNIMSMYSDIDLDANCVESNFKTAFEEVINFVLIHLYNSGMGDFSAEKYEVIFNRDMLISESEVIDNCIKSLGILSMETSVAQHPWVDDVQKELERKNREKNNEKENVNEN
jgi:SPP1 family phage portal protein